MRHIHFRTEAVKQMRGESIYWRYILATQLIKKIGQSVVLSQDTRFRDPGTSLQIREAATALDWQLEKVLQEGWERNARLPYQQIRNTIEANQVEPFYPRSWSCLTSYLFQSKLH